MFLVNWFTRLHSLFLITLFHSLIPLALVIITFRSLLPSPFSLLPSLSCLFFIHFPSYSRLYIQHNFPFVHLERIPFSSYSPMGHSFLGTAKPREYRGRGVTVLRGALGEGYWFCFLFVFMWSFGFEFGFGSGSCFDSCLVLFWSSGFWILAICFCRANSALSIDSALVGGRSFEFTSISLLSSSTSAFIVKIWVV